MGILLDTVIKNYVRSSTSTVSFWNIPNQARMCRLPMKIENGMITSAGTTSKFTVRSGGDAIDFIDFLFARGRESLLAKFGPAPVST